MRELVIKEVAFTQPRTVVDKVWCDVCGAAAKTAFPSQGDGKVSWVDTWEFDKTTVSRSVGWAADGEGAQTTTFYHVCPACWVKLAAWIEAQCGAKPTVEENEFW